MRYVDHIARKEDRWNSYKFLVGKPDEITR